MPVLAVLPALISAGAGVAGAVSSIKAGNRQNKGIQSQLDIAKAEEARRQAIYDKLVPFFSEYMKSGSPFLQNIQRAAAENTATNANNAAGQIREVTGASGLGYGPSGTTAAALGGLGAETGRTASSNYLTNLLNNEQIKFQAAQGIAGLNNGPQINPVPSQYPINPIPGAIGSLGTALENILKRLPGKRAPGGSYPIPPGGSSPAPGSGLPGTTAPTTSGWSFGP